jgi:hypothetical protein
MCAVAQRYAWKRGARTSVCKICAGKVTLPFSKLIAQACKVNFRKRIVGAREIATGSIKDRSRADKVVTRLVMKSDRQLNQTLQMPAAGASAGRRPPNVFQHLVGVEKMSAIEQPDAPYQVSTIGFHFSSL